MADYLQLSLVWQLQDSLQRVVDWALRERTMFKADNLVGELQLQVLPGCSAGQFTEAAKGMRASPVNEQQNRLIRLQRFLVGNHVLRS
ncbi:hypothetical protein D3C79_663100 [compost metagenome]